MVPFAAAPGPHLPSSPLHAPVSAWEGVLLVPHGLAGKRALMRILPALREVWNDLIMRAANEALLAKSVTAEPAFARGEIAHIAIEHGDTDRCLLDEQAKLLGALPQGHNRAFFCDALDAWPCLRLSWWKFIGAVDRWRLSVLRKSCFMATLVFSGRFDSVVVSQCTDRIRRWTSSDLPQNRCRVKYSAARSKLQS